MSDDLTFRAGSERIRAGMRLAGCRKNKLFFDCVSGGTVPIRKVSREEGVLSLRLHYT